jgi:hypothetical protein
MLTEFCLQEESGSVSFTEFIWDGKLKVVRREGAVIWYLKQLVASRAARFAVGTDINRPYDAANPQHRQRSRLILKDGLEYVPLHLETGFSDA